MIENLSIQFQMKQVEREFAATEKQLLNARARALRKTGKKAGVMTRRTLSADTKIPQKHLKERFYISKVLPQEAEVELWIGTYNVEPHNISNPKQTKRGTRAGRGRFYRGAFFKGVYGPTKKVWIRKGSKHYAPGEYPSKPGKSIVPKALEGRFPVVKASIKIEEEAEAALKKNMPEIDKEFEKIYRQELNYEVNIRGNR